MPIYSLYLSTLINTPVSNIVVPIDRTVLWNVAWNIDWDNLFRKEQDNYKYCRVRFHLVSNRWNTIGNNNDWNDFQGYLGCNLPSAYGATTTNGTMLGLVYPRDVFATSSSTQHCIVISTMEEVGVDINMPRGNSMLRLYFMKSAEVAFMAGTPEYEIQLTFELYN
jgi:hypothetical protein